MLLHLYPFILGLTGAAYAKFGAVTDYAPLINQPCPNTTTNPLLRVFTPHDQTLHPGEAAYVDTRLSTVIPNEWKNWVGDGSGIGYNLSAFNNSFPKIGIAVSGGGYRAAQYGAGVLSGLDARNDSAKQAGTGGLLQVASYLSGLSGGSWLTGSLYTNDFPTIKDLVYGNGDDLTGWLLDLDLATPGGTDIFSDENQHFYGSILWSVIAKGNTSIDTSLTDPWARMISYHFLNQTDRNNFFTNDSAHGAGQLWSQVPLIPSWQQHLVPFPIIQTDSRPAGSNLTTSLPPTAVVYEITPMEWGSWDPNLSAMMNISYAGTHLNNGQPDNNTACVTNFDQTGFMMGTSASLFNQILDFAHNTIQGFDHSAAQGLLNMLSRQLGALRTRADDVANWPSPFYNLTGKANFEDLNSKWLELIDGASNHENVPLGQHFVKARGIDLVVAIDASADLSTGWPNGSSPYLSAARITTLLQSSHQMFPPLPGNTAGFVSTGVNMRPVFFGCFPTQTPPEYPIVIYFPNSPPLNGDDPVSNTGTFKLDYTPLHTQLFLDQVHANVIGGFVPNTNAPDPNFGKCTQCAAIDRARLKTSPPLQRSTFCQACFAQYCFDPNNLTSAAQLPGRKLAFVDPDPQGVSAVTGFLSDSKLAILLGFLGAALAIAGICAFLIWRKRRRSAQYQKVMELHEDEPPFIQHNMYRDGPRATSSYELGNLPDLSYVPEEHRRR
ncbi:phospholipase B [Lactarius pseudohatsudake]|nr:phospholipase B [Lactarius pseudohatsudake]